MRLECSEDEASQREAHHGAVEIAVQDWRPKRIGGGHWEGDRPSGAVPKATCVLFLGIGAVSGPHAQGCRRWWLLTEHLEPPPSAWIALSRAWRSSSHMALGSLLKPRPWDGSSVAGAPLKPFLWTQFPNLCPRE